MYIKKVCDAHGINAIGEEMSYSALNDYDRTESIPKIFSRGYGLKHKYCDPEREEQERIGIKRSGFYSQAKKFSEILQSEEIKNLTQEEADELEWKEDLKREPSWLCNILELNSWPLLFICGPKHVESFSGLLIASTFDVKIINSNWDPKSK